MHLDFVKYNKGPQSFMDEAGRTILNSVLPWAEITQKGHNKFFFVLGRGLFSQPQNKDIKDIFGNTRWILFS